MYGKEKAEKIKNKLKMYSGENSSSWGRRHTNEAKKKMSDFIKRNGGRSGENNPMYGKKQPTDICIYCGKVCSKTNIIK